MSYNVEQLSIADDVMSLEQFEAFRMEHRIDVALQEAQQEAAENPTQYDFDEVSSNLRKKLIAKMDGNSIYI